MLLLTQTITEMNKQHGRLLDQLHEDRKKISRLEEKIDQLAENQEFLVGAKKRKLELGKGYREKKKSRTSIQVGSMIDDFINKKNIKM